MNKSAPSVARLEAVAAALGVSWHTVIRRTSSGCFPPADVRLSGRGQEQFAWSLPALTAHDPALADRVGRMLEVLGAQG